MRWVRAAAVATALMVNMGALSGGLAGCSSSESSQAAQQHASTVVGTEGGNVTTSDGSGVSIPAGAVPANVTITVNATPSAPTPSQGTAVGTPYTFGPEGQQFSVPVTVTLAFDPTLLPAGKTASDIVIFTAPAGTTDYTPLGTSIVNTTHAAAQTTHFSTFVCIIPLQPLPNEDSGTTAFDATTVADSSLPPASDATIGDNDDSSAAFDSSTPAQDATAFDAGSAEDATIGSDSGFSGQDGGTTGPSDATIGNSDSGSGPIQDASLASDGGSGGPTDASSGSDSGQGCSLGADLAGSIIPLQKIAGLNMNAGGPGTASLAYAESVLCGPAAFGGQEDAGADPGTTLENWGAGDISGEVNDTAPNLIKYLAVQGAYTGSVAFTSRSGGPFGSGHSYQVRLGSMTKDGSPFTIDWANESAALNELADGMMSTFAPGFPAAAGGDWVTGGAVLDIPDDGSNPDGGPGIAYFGLRPLKIYVEMPSGTSTPTLMYTFFAGSFPVADAGIPGLPGDGGITLPSGCYFQSGNGSGTLEGNCENPAAPFCSNSNFPASSPVACQDWPQSGYQATCCPTDAGP